jgi:hypothetical protein
MGDLQEMYRGIVCHGLRIKVFFGYFVKKGQLLRVVREQFRKEQ